MVSNGLAQCSKIAKLTSVKSEVVGRASGDASALVEVLHLARERDSGGVASGRIRIDTLGAGVGGGLGVSSGRALVTVNASIAAEEEAALAANAKGERDHGRQRERSSMSAHLNT